MNLKRSVMLFAVMFACIAGDQATKAMARALLTEGQLHSYLGDTLRLQLAYNTGAFLSLGATMPENLRSSLFSIGVACVLLGLLVYALLAKNEPPPATLALALVLGGGTSNLIDRLLFDGHVTDFLNMGIGGLRTGIFNVADLAITGGVLFLLWLGFRRPQGAEKKN
jgi:signal peptidase II